MQQSSFLRALAAVLFTAVCAWTLAHFTQSGAARIESAAAASPPPAVSGGTALDGIVIRRERVLSAPSAHVSTTAEDGERLSADAVAAFADGEAVIARESAVFFSETDGYEYLSPDELTGFSADTLEKLLSAEPKTEAGAFGRLVTDFAWYYAAAPESGGTVKKGRCEVRFEDFTEAIEGEVISALPGAVLIRLTDGAPEYLSLRRTKAELK